MVLLLYNSTVRSWSILGAGTPETWFTLKIVPIWYGTNAFSTICLSLGLSTSISVDESNSMSYPCTYAFPDETLTHIMSSSGILPLSVNSPVL